MAGASKPSSGLSTGIEGTWTIHGYNMYIGPTNMFNGNLTNYSEWYQTNQYLDITINQLSDIWDCNYANYSSRLNVYTNTGGVKGTLVYTTAGNTGVAHQAWYKLIPALSAGRYRIEMDPTDAGADHATYEWYIDTYVPFSPPNVKRQVSHAIHTGSVLHTKTTVAAVEQALFGKVNGTYTSADAGYWHSTYSYVDIDIVADCNLWVIGSTDYPTYNQGSSYRLNVDRWNGTAWVYVGQTQAGNGANWGIIYPNLPKGRYKFYSGVNSLIDTIHGEWYLEGISDIDVDIVPQMMSNTTPSPWVTSVTNVYSATYPAWKSFNDYSDLNDRKCSGSNTVPATWEITGDGTYYTVSKYSISGENQSANTIYNPKNWTLQGQIADGSWVVLHTVTNAAYIGADPNVYTTYYPTNLVPCKNFRYVVSANYGAAWVFIGLLHLYYSTSSTKYLIEDSGNLYKIVSGVNTLVGTTPATKELFISDGMNVVTGITSGVLDALTSPSPKLLTCDVGKISSPKTVRIKHTPDPVLILPVGDVSLEFVTNVENVDISYTQTGDGKVRVIVSIDSGVTWYTWNGSIWSAIDVASLSSIATDGITPSTLDSLSSANWMALIGTSKVIRFGYYIEQVASTDTASVHSMFMQVDMLGYWGLAVRGTDYTYGYPANTAMKINILTDGTYKINY